MGEAFENAFGWAAGEAGRLDWAAAVGLLVVGVAVAAVAIAVGLAVAYYLGHGPLTTDAGSTLAAAGVRRWHRARGTADRTRWLCARCRSWNVPSADACYRGCGPRVAVELPPPADAVEAVSELGEEATIDAAAGTGGERRPVLGTGDGPERPF